MDFIAACLLVVLWFVRPQDIFAVISGVSLVKYLMYFAIVCTVRRREGFSLKKVLETPIDYLVTTYCLWAVYVTPDHVGASKEVFTYFCFHVVTALALNSWHRIEIYINWWLASLGTVAFLAVSTHWGFELVQGSAQATAWFHDRLCLNTWIFINPNSLGHGVVALVPAGISWFALEGGRNRVIGVLLVGLALHCVILTQSKGAYMAGAGALTLLFLFRRPVLVQIVVLALAAGAGGALLMSLPRMNTLSKSDEGIQGRMIVWQQAMHSMEASKTGLGLKMFQGYVPVRFPKLHRTVNIPIATHGSYVRNGADLGYVGLMLFGGIFYAGVRISSQAKGPKRGVPFRAQRTLFALVVTAALSCFVVDRAYQMDLFLLSGALSAFHRRCIHRNEMSPAEATLADSGDRTAASDKRSNHEVNSDTSMGTSFESNLGGEQMELSWRRLGILDLVAMYVLLELVLYYWELLSTDFIVF